MIARIALIKWVEIINFFSQFLERNSSLREKKFQDFNYRKYCKNKENSSFFRTVKFELLTWKMIRIGLAYLKNSRKTVRKLDAHYFYSKFHVKEILFLVQVRSLIEHDKKMNIKFAKM